jgi:hypothetical protein
VTHQIVDEATMFFEIRKYDHDFATVVKLLPRQTGIGLTP